MSLITQEELKELLYYNPNTGKFKWRITRSGRYNQKGRVAGCSYNGYITIELNGRTYQAHRLAFLYITGKWPIGQVDHINNKSNDNKWINLRDTTQSINQHNNTQGLMGRNCRGVYFTKNLHYKPWRAIIQFQNKSFHIGYFFTEHDAQQAYLTKKEELLNNSEV